MQDTTVRGVVGDRPRSHSSHVLRAAILGLAVAAVAVAGLYALRASLVEKNFCGSACEPVPIAYVAPGGDDAAA